jgi:predicted PurR-regulated permease PerM
VEQRSNQNATQRRVFSQATTSAKRPPLAVLLVSSGSPLVLCVSLTRQRAEICHELTIKIVGVAGTLFADCCGFSARMPYEPDSKNKSVAANYSGPGQRLPAPIIAFGIVLTIACLYWAQAVLIPFALTILLTFLLGPLVSLLQRRGLGRGGAVAVVIFLTLVVLTTIGWVAFAQITSLAGELPKYRHNITQIIRDLRGMGRGGALEQIQETFEEVKDEIERGDPPPKGRKPAPIVVQPASSWRSLYLGPLAQPLASAGLVLGLLIFMLAQREELRNRLIRVVGYGNLTITTKALEDAGQRISRYLLMQITINGCFGLIVAMALFAIGLPYAFLWGLLAVPLLFIPIIGFWVATAMPTILSLAFFRDWWWALVVVGVFLGLKTIINMLLEPLLYGKSVGVSPAPLLMMIAFWTWLWGPIGLVLATPMTVCLVVFAKYVPQLQFLTVLLSDEPVLENRISYYQRLLALDQEEATDIAKEFLKNNPPERVYDDVLVPALSYAKEDRRRGKLDGNEQQFIFDATRKILQELSFEPVGIENSQNGSPELQSDSGLQKIRLLGCPAHDEADEIALWMLRQLLDPSRYDFTIVPAGTLASEIIAVAKEREAPLICIAALPPGGIAQTRYLCKRLRALFPGAQIVVGRWGHRGVLDEPANSVRSIGADQVGGSLLESRDQITNLRQRIRNSMTRVPSDGEEGAPVTNPAEPESTRGAS